MDDSSCKLISKKVVIKEKILASKKNSKQVLSVAIREKYLYMLGPKKGRIYESQTFREVILAISDLAGTFFLGLFRRGGG